MRQRGVNRSGTVRQSDARITSEAGRMVRQTEDEGGIARVTEFTYNGDGNVLKRGNSGEFRGDNTHSVSRPG